MGTELEFEEFDLSSFAQVRDMINMAYDHIMSQANPTLNLAREHFFPQVGLEDFVADDFRAALAKFPELGEERMVVVPRGTEQAPHMGKVGTVYMPNKWIYMMPEERRPIIQPSEPFTIAKALETELKLIEHYAATVKDAIAKMHALRLLFYDGLSRISKRRATSLYPDLARQFGLAKPKGNPREQIPLLLGPEERDKSLPTVIDYTLDNIRIKDDPFQKFIEVCEAIEQRIQVATSRQNIASLKAPIDYLLDEMINIDKYNKLESEEKLALQAYCTGLMGSYLVWMASAVFADPKDPQSYQVVLNLTHCSRNLLNATKSYDTKVTPETQGEITAEQMLNIHLQILQMDFTLLSGSYLGRQDYSGGQLNNLSPFSIPTKLNPKHIWDLARCLICKGDGVYAKAEALNGSRETTVEFLHNTQYTAVGELFDMRRR